MSSMSVDRSPSPQGGGSSQDSSCSFPKIGAGQGREIKNLTRQKNGDQSSVDQSVTASSTKSEIIYHRSMSEGTGDGANESLSNPLNVKIVVSNEEILELEHKMFGSMGNQSLLGVMSIADLQEAKGSRNRAGAVSVITPSSAARSITPYSTAMSITQSVPASPMSTAGATPSPASPMPAASAPSVQERPSSANTVTSPSSAASAASSSARVSGAPAGSSRHKGISIGVVQGVEVTRLAKGACKEIYPNPSDPLKVFYAPFNGNKDAEKELQEEVGKIYQMQAKLFGPALIELIASKEITALGLSEHTIGCLMLFSSVEVMRKELCSDNGDHKGILESGGDLGKLRAYFSRNPVPDGLKKALEVGQHLAINVHSVKRDEDKVDGRYTLETLRASGDVDGLLKDPTRYNFDDLLDMSSQVLDGMSDLHKAGFVHGDVKSENALFSGTTGNFQVKVSDFGKAEQIKEDGSNWWYKGNSRHGPPENRLSMKGDVYSTGVQLLRMFEDRILVQKKSLWLVSPDNQGLMTAAHKPGKDRRGYEAYVIESSTFDAVELDYTKTQKVLGFLVKCKNMLFPTRESQLKRIEFENNRYIDALVSNMKEMEGILPESTDSVKAEAIDRLGYFIKQMMSVHPEKRPTMAVAANLFKSVSLAFTG